ncbi:MAG TPA: tetratricopeptide repeat protein [Bacteroidales bacterium]|nr:tetratricopeptide repeat protein [Bacteroidales bacterium]
MKKLITILTIFTLSIFTVNSSDLAKAKEMLYEAYIHNDTHLWSEVMNDLEKSYKKSENIFTLFELTKSQYGFMGFLIDRGKFEEAKNILPKSEKNIETLLSYNSDWADAHGLKAGIYGFKIILYPNYVIINGPKGKGYLNKATSYDAISASVIVEMANYKYHTPSLLGGDIDEAIQYYQYALRIFELTNQKKNNWQYINTMVWLAISLDKKGDSTEAKKVLEKVLTQEPDFEWVKEDLYPKILRNESISKTYYTSK